MTIRLNLVGWKAFAAVKNKRVMSRWMAKVANESEKVFKAGMNGKHSGRVYRLLGGARYGAGVHRASAPGEYPANRSGRLLRSIKTESSDTEATIGTSRPYSRWLREGTRHMARRKMSDNAIQDGAARAVRSSRGWLRWTKGGP